MVNCFNIHPRSFVEHHCHGVRETDLRHDGDGEEELLALPSSQETRIYALVRERFSKLVFKALHAEDVLGAQSC